MAFDEGFIAERVALVAQHIVAAPQPVDMAVAILTGAFVFAADMLRALARHGLDLPIEFVSLSRYGRAREGADDIAVRLGPTAAVRGRHVLLIDGVLDHGHTLGQGACACPRCGCGFGHDCGRGRQGARRRTVESRLRGVSGIDAFIVGYGMDDAGAGRGLPYIASVE